MPPLSLHLALAAAVLVLAPPLALSHLCSAPPGGPCPPFPSSSPPPYPFSASPGCGHPSFQIRCASPHSLLSINGLPFSLLRYDPNSSSLTLSPRPAPPPDGNCSSSSSPPPTTTTPSSRPSAIPSRAISLSGSPFRVSDSSCSRLSVLRPCSPPNLPNCSRCPWECKLIKSPVRLLSDCGSNAHRLSSEQGCQADVLGFLDNVLNFGIEVEFDLAQDSYFASCRACRADGGVCGFNFDDPGKQFVCFGAQSRFSPPWIRRGDPNRVAVLLLALTCALLLFSVIVAIFRSRRLEASSSSEEDPTVVFLRRHRSASLLPPVFTYDELEESTDRFDPRRKIGDGGFGSVFLGRLRDGRTVAVKHLHKHHNAAAAAARAFSTKLFCNEILILSSIDHPNLVKLHGYCSDPRGLLLVYDYVPNGTLADHLHGCKSSHKKGSLTWPVRLDMALQIATAIEYLHFSVTPPIVHRDITSSNIFVEKDMRIKVGDFGLSRLLVFDRTGNPSSTTGSEYIWTGPQGTPGYLDPDYHRSFRLTDKSDVYSFGVVLLELVSGMKAVDQERAKAEVALADLVVSRIQTGMLHQVVDPAMAVGGGGEGEAAAMEEGVSAVAELAFRCVAADKDDRPDAREVAEELRRIRGRARAGAPV
ncbi:LEAF RUST 10 DISEASE-RESISTANCE LOCUS RECEPTOR-LIKE PROTEIN KINASE-like 1.5 [Syzygium oleosum]|uniref:LEAF RUST 10 DISEASE-RESISTANCE LOCUS RECEPTOR-LIKE PROTEIN KINASE-like 1.5 n=1 Tax=Syzygium oleosum TaxID=219896 RepID=UPI0024B9A952|nr:LEAF RUST 10 DISEASE-RESISTANCE LOCUS RECEPTOR-LIKE PROTEIN KINASE-like 1.5 [Syzygium oleosum]